MSPCFKPLVLFHWMVLVNWRKSSSSCNKSVSFYLIDEMMYDIRDHGVVYPYAHLIPYPPPPHESISLSKGWKWTFYFTQTRQFQYLVGHPRVEVSFRLGFAKPHNNLYSPLWGPQVFQNCDSQPPKDPGFSYFNPLPTSYGGGGVHNLIITFVFASRIIYNNALVQINGILIYYVLVIPITISKAHFLKE